MGFNFTTKDGFIYDLDKDYDDSVAHRIIILYNLVYDLNDSDADKLTTRYMLGMISGWIKELFLTEQGGK